MKSLDFKSVMIMAILCTAIIIPTFLSANCDMMAMIAKEGHYISWLNSSSSGYHYPYDFFQFLKDRSNNDDTSDKYSDDGYGVLYYKANGYFYLDPDNLGHEEGIPGDPLNQAWYQIDGDYVDGDPYDTHYPFTTYYINDLSDPDCVASCINGEYTWKWEMDMAEYVIMDDDTEATIVLGHDRQGSTGSGNHPFRFVYTNPGTVDTITYSFMHNGSIEGDMKSAIKTFLCNLVIGDDNWFDLHPLNWLEDPGSAAITDFIDSELYFHYIMYHITVDDQTGTHITVSDGDVIQRLYDAINEDDFRYDSNHPNYTFDVQNSLRNLDYLGNYGGGNFSANFIMSDGKNIYTFRNDADNYHSLGFYENNSFVGIRTWGSGDYEELSVYELAVFTPYGNPHGFDVAYNPTRITNFLLPEDDYQPLVFEQGTITQNLNHSVEIENEPRLWFTDDVTISSDIEITEDTSVGIANHVTIQIDGNLTIKDNAALHLNHASTINIDGSGAQLFLDWGSTITGTNSGWYEQIPPGQPANGEEEWIPGDRIIAQNGGIITTGDIDDFVLHPGYPNNVPEAIISSSSEHYWDGIYIENPGDLDEFWFVNCDIQDIVQFSIRNIGDSRNIASLKLYRTDFINAGQIVAMDGHNLYINGESDYLCYFHNNAPAPICAYESSVYLDYVWIGGLIENDDLENKGGIYLYDTGDNSSIITNCNIMYNEGNGVKLNGACVEFNHNTIEENYYYGMLCFPGTIFDGEFPFDYITILDNGYAEYVGWQETFNMGEDRIGIDISDSDYSSGSDQYLLMNLNWDESTEVDIRGVEVNGNPITIEYLPHLLPSNEAAWNFGTEIPDERLMLYSAASDMGSGNYTTAEQTLQQIIVDYPLTQEAGIAVYYLYHLENLFEQDFPGLRNYLENIYVVADTPLEKAAEKIITKSYMKDKDYLTVIDRLETVINNSQIPDEVIMAMIDEGYCYMELSEGGERGLPVNCSVKTSTLVEYQARVRELESQFSFYPEEQDQESVPIAENILSLSNFPNPFNPTTTISFEIASDSNVAIEVYNIKGQKVKILVDEHLSKGSHTVMWNGIDNNNKAVASGIYFYKISAGKSSAMKKMLLLK